MVPGVVVQDNSVEVNHMNTLVIDFHNHAGRWGSTGIDDELNRYLRIMDASGVDKANINCIFYGSARLSNNTAARFVDLHPDRFIGVGFVTPHYPNETIPELERCFSELDMKSLKIYPNYFGSTVDDPAYDPIYEWCDEREIVIMSHSSFTSDSDQLTHPERFIGLAERFPGIRWVLAHSGNSMKGQIAAVKAAKSAPNIYLETATSFGEHGTIEFLVDGAGPDRVLYGSDMPLLDARAMVGRIVTADLPDETKRKVLGLNAAKLLGLEL